MECLELTVKVLLIVAGVHIGVQTHAVRVVEIKIPQRYCVPAHYHVRALQLDSLISVAVANRLGVDHQVGDGNRLEVKPKLTVGGHHFKVKVDDCLAKIVLALVDREAEVILNFFDQSASLLSFSALERHIFVVAGIVDSIGAEVFGDEVAGFLGSFVASGFYHKDI
jgi:hypothetical protein